MSRTEFTERCPEKSTSSYTAIVRDEKLAAIPAAQLSSLTLTLYDEATGTIINGLDNADVLNTGRGTVDSAGVVTITFASLDNALINPAAFEELHVALLRYSWAGNTKNSSHEVAFYVKNREKVS